MKKFILYFGFSVFSVGFVLGFLNDRQGILYTAYDAVRPKLVAAGGKDCLQRLREMNIEFKYLGDVEEKSCLIKNAVQIGTLPGVNLSSGVTLNCKTALDFAKWVAEIEASNIVHMGSYNCRKMRTLNIMSEHSFGSAIDIAAIDGASVKRDWSKNDYNGNAIKKAALTACKYFSNVITPNDNALHHDHLHFDNGYRSTCLADWMIKVKKAVLKYTP